MKSLVHCGFLIWGTCFNTNWVRFFLGETNKKSKVELERNQKFVFVFQGIYNISEYDKVLRKLHARYGPVVRQDIGTRTVIHAFDPDDVQTVLSCDGKTPTVPPLQETTKLYREKRQLSPGLGNT